MGGQAREVLSVAFMHAMSFALKRAHLRAVAFGRKAIGHVEGMTPSRFDLLYLLRRVEILCKPACHPLDGARAQLELVQDLGLHRSTVSKMLKRLEEMGWIRRTRCLLDRRINNVALTELGLRAIWRAMRRVFRGKKLPRRAYEEIFRDREASPPVVPSPGGTRHVVHIIYDAYRMLRAVARRFGDSSFLWYDLGHGLPPRERYLS
jgi:DNA-binding MarR family transcriptional regulator